MTVPVSTTFVSFRNDQYNYNDTTINPRKAICVYLCQSDQTCTHCPRTCRFSGKAFCRCDPNPNWEDRTANLQSRSCVTLPPHPVCACICVRTRMQKQLKWEKISRVSTPRSDDNDDDEEIITGTLDQNDLPVPYTSLAGPLARWPTILGRRFAT